MKYFYILFIFLMGCSSTQTRGRISLNLEIERVSVSGQVSVFNLKNLSSSSIFYEHWFGQDGKPVAYCKNSVDLWVCSTEVYLIEDDYYTHETVLESKGKARFVANINRAEQIGIKYYIQNVGLTEKFLWLDIGK